MNWVKEYGLMAGVIAVIFQSGITYANYLYMRRSMVTKKDMKIAILEWNGEMEEKFLSKNDVLKEFELCRALNHKKKPNGAMAYDHTQ